MVDKKRQKSLLLMNTKRPERRCREWSKWSSLLTGIAVGAAVVAAGAICVAAGVAFAAIAGGAMLMTTATTAAALEVADVVTKVAVVSAAAKGTLGYTWNQVSNEVLYWSGI